MADFRLFDPATDGGFFTNGAGTDAAVGKGTPTAPIATGTDSFAQGNGSSASGNQSFASGYNVDVSGNYSQGFGYTVDVGGDRTFAAGYYINASNAGAYNCAHFGRFQYNYGQYSCFSVGNNNYFNGTEGGYNTLLGDFNQVNAGPGATLGTYASIAVGQSNELNYCQTGGAFGRDVDIDGAAGFGINDRGNQSFGFGRDIVLAGSNNFALGRNITIAAATTGADAPTPNQARETFAHGTNILIGRDNQKCWGSGVQGNYNSKVIRQLETTDATTTTIFDMALGGDSAYSVRVQLVGKVSGVSTETAVWDAAGILLNGSGPTIVGGGVIAADNTNGATGGSLAFDVTAGGAGVEFRVTGVAATTVRWCICVEFTECS